MHPRPIKVGFLIFRFLFFLHALITSGIILSFDQSPPPITLPERTVKIFFDYFLVILYLCRNLLCVQWQLYSHCMLHDLAGYHFLYTFYHLGLYKLYLWL